MEELATPTVISVKKKALLLRPMNLYVFREQLTLIIRVARSFTVDTSVIDHVCEIIYVPWFVKSNVAKSVFTPNAMSIARPRVHLVRKHVSGEHYLIS